MPPVFRLRALQLDLARQLERPEAIRRIADVAAENGYNTLVFYLEDRVKTASYPYSPDEESYSPQVMRELVAYASARGLDVIPVVSTLGHTERFLRHPQMRALAEGRTGAAGRCGEAFNVVCPSLEESYAFWQTYLAELAEIFPSQYFHLGGDEVWNIALCPLCRERLGRGEGVDVLFAEHISRIHAILRAVGKRAMMWDDMFEEFPAALALVPADIVQCVWQYDARVNQTRSHFGRRFSDHRLAEYDRRGIQYLIAPVAWNLLNAETYTDYARQFKPLGALMTRWEGSFFEEETLICASAGRLWASPEQGAEAALDGATRWLLGSEPDEPFRSVLQGVSHASYWPLVDDVAKLLDHAVSAYGTEFREYRRLCEMAFVANKERFAAGYAEDYRDAVLLRLRQEQLQFALKDGLFEVLRTRVAGRPALTGQLARLREIDDALTDVQTQWHDFWARLRAGVPVGAGRTPEERVARLRASLKNFLADAEGTSASWSFFRVGYSLPDFYGWPRVRWSVQYATSGEWVEIYHANPKHSFRDYSDCPFFQTGTILPADGAPQRLRLEYRGYCGIGVQYLKFFAGGRVYLPTAIAGTSGPVRGAENLLHGDTNWCRLGISSQTGIFADDPTALPISTLEIVLTDSGPALFP